MHLVGDPVPDLIFRSCQLSSVHFEGNSVQRGGRLVKCLNSDFDCPHYPDQLDHASVENAT